MQRLRFDPSAAFAPRDPQLENVTVAPLTASLGAGSAVQAAVFRLAPGGRLRRHPAAVAQILAVLDGQGLVSGPDGVFEPIVAGEAVYWAAGEQHETRSVDGLAVLILEGEGLVPFAGGS